ncbi:hypothetical protein SARU107417_04170 [Salinibacter ruber]
MPRLDRKRTVGPPLGVPHVAGHPEGLPPPRERGLRLEPQVAGPLRGAGVEGAKLVGIQHDRPVGAAAPVGGLHAVAHHPGDQLLLVGQLRLRVDGPGQPQGRLFEVGRGREQCGRFFPGGIELGPCAWPRGAGRGGGVCGGQLLQGGGRAAACTGGARLGNRCVPGSVDAGFGVGVRRHRPRRKDKRADGCAEKNRTFAHIPVCAIRRPSRRRPGHKAPRGTKRRARPKYVSVQSFCDCIMRNHGGST